MKISKKIQTEQTVEIEVETPAWFKIGNDLELKIYQVNSDQDIIEVQINRRFTTVSRLPMKYMYKPEDIFDGEKVTELEFNQAMSEAITKISGVEISKEQPLSIAS